MEKKEVRKKVNSLILAMSRSERDRRSAEVERNILSLDEFRDARCVAAYVALPFEVKIDALMLECLETEKTLMLPRTIWSERRMEMISVSDINTALVPGPKGIMEPVGEGIISPVEIDLVIVPGRAFDRSCNRVGQGGGFYDAFLAKLRADCVRCAPAFDVQIFDSVPVQNHDLPVDIVVTEKDVYRRP